jgi:hypothetical protein
LRGIFRALNVELRIELVDKKYKGEVGLFSKEVRNEKRLARRHNHLDHHTVICIKYPHDEEWQGQRREIKLSFVGAFAANNKSKSVTVLIKVEHHTYNDNESIPTRHLEFYLLERPFTEDSIDAGRSCCNFTLTRLDKPKDVQANQTKARKEWDKFAKQFSTLPHFRVMQEILAYESVLERVAKEEEKDAERKEKKHEEVYVSVSKDDGNDQEVASSNDELSISREQPRRRRGWSRWWEQEEDDDNDDEDGDCTNDEDDETANDEESEDCREAENGRMEFC